MEEDNKQENTLEENTLEENTLEENTLEENTLEENTLEENTLEENTQSVEIRLHVFMSRHGLGSRRECEDYIKSGLVKVNGTFVTELGFKVSPTDIVEYKGSRISWKDEEKVYIALYKPEKYICSHQDSENRPLAVSLVQPFFGQRLFYVGRLDFMTSGLLLLTNDGEFAKTLTHPSFEIEKEYEVSTKKEIPLTLLENFKRGLFINGERYQLKNYYLKNSREVNLILTEGKNQEIRQVFLSEFITIKKIHRIRIGKVVLKGLSPGQFRKLTNYEVENLLKETRSRKLRIVRDSKKSYLAKNSQENIERGVVNTQIMKPAEEIRNDRRKREFSSRGRRFSERTDSGYKRPMRERSENREMTDRSDYQPSSRGSFQRDRFNRRDFDSSRGSSNERFSQRGERGDRPFNSSRSFGGRRFSERTDSGYKRPMRERSENREMTDRSDYQPSSRGSFQRDRFNRRDFDSSRGSSNERFSQRGERGDRPFNSSRGFGGRRFSERTDSGYKRPMRERSENREMTDRSDYQPSSRGSFQRDRFNRRDFDSSRGSSNERFSQRGERGDRPFNSSRGFGGRRFSERTDSGYKRPMRERSENREMTDRSDYQPSSRGSFQRDRFNRRDFDSSRGSSNERFSQRGERGDRPFRRKREFENRPKD